MVNISIYQKYQESGNPSIIKNSKILSISEFIRWKEERDFVSEPNEKPCGRNVQHDLCLDWASDNPMVTMMLVMFHHPEELSA